MSTYQNNSNLMHFIHTLVHNSEVIIGGICNWVIAAIGTNLPNYIMLTVLLSFWDGKEVLPLMQGGVYTLAMLVSVLTLYKLAIDLKWVGKKKK